MIKKSNYKYVLQKEEYDCGVAASMSLLINCGIVGISYDKLSKDLNLSVEGVSYKTISEYFLRHKELEPKVYENANLLLLKKEVKKGNLVMIVYQGWAEESEVEKLIWGHYAIVVDIADGKLLLQDPGANEQWVKDIGWLTMDEADFEKRWIDEDAGKIVKCWMLSVKPLNS
jgi:hypothetical protein